ncbi:FAD-dependent oxidoreductase [Pleomorphomonas sp. PLEO]|uniref:FAD-dependent oxidoreductase n=1 Tax=Pleomorphomonas sp. PLEO TaxID=3239306 RepID=UPI00351EC836
MISASLTTPPITEHDICVVGSGPAGLVLALEAAQRGKRVLVLESGSVHPDRLQQALSDADIVNPALHDDMSIAVARQLGGTSNLWAVRCQPFDPIDFEARPSLIDANWPIRYEDIVPYYDRAVDYLTAGANVFRAPIAGIDISDEAVDYTRLERFSRVAAFQKAHAGEIERSTLIDVRLGATVVDMTFEGGRITSLTVADRDGTRRSLPVGTVVLAAGGLESTRQLLVLQRKHPDLLGGMDGPLGRYYMGHVIGEVADVTFSTDAFDAAYDFYIDEYGSYARRRLIPSDAAQREQRLLNVSFWPVVPPVADSRHKSGLLSMVCFAFALKPLGRLVIAEAIRKRHIPDDLAIWPHIVNIVSDLPRTVLSLTRFLYRRYIAKPPTPGFFARNAARRYGLSYHAEQSPQPDSRVTLTDDFDRLGVPKLRIDYRFARADAEAVWRAHEHLAGWLSRNGVGHLEYRQPPEETVDAILALASHGTHQIGTARMASRPEDGVVDENLRCFGVDNLYVASSAVFPTSGQCNPTLSIAAFAVRLAEHLCDGERP